jgi:hypothetical protein
VADFEGETDDEDCEMDIDGNNEDEDDLGGLNSAFATLLTEDKYEEDPISFFTSVQSLLTITIPVALTDTANTLVDDLNTLSLMH